MSTVNNYTEPQFDLPAWEDHFAAFLTAQGIVDASHGLDHIKRVVAAAKQIGATENARPEIVVPAAWLHDCVAVEKNSPDRSRASRLAAEMAYGYLKSVAYPQEFIDDICHAIEAHSFSAGIPPETIEAKVVQDADRLDALGAVGLARCFMVGERMGLPLYHEIDPLSRDREPDDRRYVLDHLFVKLFKLPGTMQTKAGREEATRRVRFLESFLQELAIELGIEEESTNN